MAAGSTRTIEIDKVLILGALVSLVALGWFSGAPIFEPFGRGRLTYLTVLGLPLVAFFLLLRRASGEMGKLVASWWPVIGILAVYESLKHMHANRITEWLGIRPKDELMLRIDEALFGQALPLWMDSWTAPWFQNLMSFFYIWVYYLGPFVLLAVAYLARKENLFRRLRLGLVLGLLGGYVLYLLVPVAGPLFLIGDRFEHPIPNHSRLETLVFDTLRFNWDCFPSLHTAIPWIMTVLIWRWLPRWVVAISALLACGVTLSTVALRFHYGVDLIAAFVWVGVVWWAVERAAVRDFGRIAVRWGRPRRRSGARVSAGRAALRRFAWAAGSICAAAAPALVAHQRWMEIWLAQPLRSVTGVLLGGALGLAIGAVLGWRTAPGPTSPSRAAAIASVAAAGWILMIGSPLPAFSVVGWSAMALDRLGSSAAGTAGPWIASSSPLLLSGLVGFVLALVARAGRDLGLPTVAASFWRSSVAGALGGLLIARFELAPRIGWGDTVLIGAVAAVLAAWKLRGTRGSTLQVLRPAPVQPSVWGVREALATTAGLAFGIVVPLWSFLYPSVFGASSRPFAAVASIVLAGSLLAVMLAEWRRLRGRELAVASWSLYACALLLALLSRVWADAPRLLSGAVAELPSAVAVGRTRGVAALFLMLGPCLLLALALRLAIPGRVGAGSRGAILGALGGAMLGICLAGSVGLGALGAPATMGVAGVAVAALSVGAVLSTSRSRARAALGLLASLPVLGLGFGAWNLAAFATGSQPGTGGRFSTPLFSSPVLEDPAAGFVAILSGESAPGDARRWLVADGLLHSEAPDDMAPVAALAGVSSSGGRARALVVGASRETARVLLRLGVAQVELVEPSMAVLRASEALDRSAPEPPALVLRAESPRGRLAPGGRFDLVISRVEDFSLGIGRGELSKEFYGRVGASLAVGGAFVQTIRLDACGPRELVSVIGALSAVMPRVSARLSGSRLLLVAPSSGSGRVEEGGDFETLAALAGLPVARVEELAGPPLLGPEQLAIWVALEGVTPSSDRDGLLESTTPDYRLVGDLSAMNVAALRTLAARIPPPPPSPEPMAPEPTAGSEPATTK